MTRLPSQLLVGASDPLIIHKGEHIAGDSAILPPLRNPRDTRIIIFGAGKIQSHSLPLEGVEVPTVTAFV